MEGLMALFERYDVLAAFFMTIRLALASAVGSLLIGTVIVVCRVSPVAVLQRFGASYVTVFRNTPLTLILALCMLGLNYILGIQIDSENLYSNSFWWAVVGLSFYHASFVAEALRSGINTVPAGQAEAARSIGLSFLPTLRYVILPQAFRGAIAPLGNTMIALTKNTTVAATIGVAEAAFVMWNMFEFSPQYLYATFFIMAAGFVILTLPLGLLFTWLSNRLVVVR
ncbi:MAG: amino acid ABC transporter permease [Propionibacteriaceae bacterium]|nr:amino acid ABC transporter permease [Propionibacteriaceae bacterium]